MSAFEQLDRKHQQQQPAAQQPPSQQQVTPQLNTTQVFFQKQQQQQQQQQQYAQGASLQHPYSQLSTPNHAYPQSAPNNANPQQNYWQQQQAAQQAAANQLQGQQTPQPAGSFTNQPQNAQSQSHHAQSMHPYAHAHYQQTQPQHFNYHHHPQVPHSAPFQPQHHSNHFNGAQGGYAASVNMINPHHGHHPHSQAQFGQQFGHHQAHGANGHHHGASGASQGGPAQQMMPAGQRWSKPISDFEVSTFISTYMPWVSLADKQRREKNAQLTIAQQKAGELNRTGMDPASLHEAEQKMKQAQDEAEQGVESSAQYKQLLRQHPASAAAMRAQIRCPERLAIYIERAFSKCISDVERDFMRQQLERICEASKLRNDFFIKQWEMMPLPCLQRESTSYQAMNERLVRGESNTNVPFPAQGPGGSTPGDTPMSAGQTSGLLADSTSGVRNGATPGQQNNVAPFQILGSDARSPSASVSAFPDNQSNFRTPTDRTPFGRHNSKDQSTSLPASRQQQMADQEMIKRLKRLEKFELQQSMKAKITKKMLQQNSTLVLAQHSQSDPSQSSQTIQEKSAYAFVTEETLGMDLNEMARHLTIKGTSTQLDKHYFRLTQAPDPADVRPEPILRQAFKLFKQKWEERSSDYKYIDDMFRALRQDMTVQRIQNDFCVKVYETHARIALQNDDLDQFNQCQTQLKQLYKSSDQLKGNRIEFLAYQLMYSMFCELETETQRMLKQLTVNEKQQEPIQHALKVRKALAQGNYARFFKLYRDAPNLGKHLIDTFIEKFRVLALRNIAIGFVAQGVSISFITQNLAFDDEEECLKFITTSIDPVNKDSEGQPKTIGLGCKVQETGGEMKLDCRNSLGILRKAPLKVRTCNK